MSEVEIPNLKDEKKKLRQLNREVQDSLLESVLRIFHTVSEHVDVSHTQNSKFEFFVSHSIIYTYNIYIMSEETSVMDEKKKLRQLNREVQDSLLESVMEDREKGRKIRMKFLLRQSDVRFQFSNFQFQFFIHSNLFNTLITHHSLYMCTYSRFFCLVAHILIHMLSSYSARNLRLTLRIVNLKNSLTHSSLFNETHNIFKIALVFYVQSLTSY